jgi:predicted esterase
VEESAEVLRQLGGEVTMRLYPGMGHLVNDDEIEALRALIARAVATRAT